MPLSSVLPTGVLSLNRTGALSPVRTQAAKPLRAMPVKLLKTMPVRPLRVMQVKLLRAMLGALSPRARPVRNAARVSIPRSATRVLGRPLKPATSCVAEPVFAPVFARLTRRSVTEKTALLCALRTEPVGSSLALALTPVSMMGTYVAARSATQGPSSVPLRVTPKPATHTDVGRRPRPATSRVSRDPARVSVSLVPRIAREHF